MKANMPRYMELTFYSCAGRYNSKCFLQNGRPIYNATHVSHTSSLSAVQNIVAGLNTSIPSQFCSIPTPLEHSTYTGLPHPAPHSSML